MIELSKLDFEFVRIIYFWVRRWISRKKWI